MSTNILLRKLKTHKFRRLTEKNAQKNSANEKSAQNTFRAHQHIIGHVRVHINVRICMYVSRSRSTKKTPLDFIAAFVCSRCEDKSKGNNNNGGRSQ